MITAEDAEFAEGGLPAGPRWALGLCKRLMSSCFLARSSLRSLRRCEKLFPWLGSGSTGMCPPVVSESGEDNRRGGGAATKPDRGRSRKDAKAAAKIAKKNLPKESPVVRLRSSAEKTSPATPCFPATTISKPAEFGLFLTGLGAAKWIKQKQDRSSRMTAWRT